MILFGELKRAMNIVRVDQCRAMLLDNVHEAAKTVQLRNLEDFFQLCDNCLLIQPFEF